MTSPIVGLRVCDLLIKFVFMPRELVGLAAVTHGADFVPSQTTQSKTLEIVYTSSKTYYAVEPDQLINP